MFPNLRRQHEPIFFLNPDFWEFPQISFRDRSWSHRPRWYTERDKSDYSQNWQIYSKDYLLTLKPLTEALNPAEIKLLELYE